MLRLRRYRSAVEAESAAEFLRQHGLVVRVVQVLGAIPTLGGAWPSDSELYLGEPDRREEAERLLAEMAASPLVLDPAWEEDARPDLARLDPALAPACPGCGVVLPLDDRLDACPGCGVGIDIAELIVQQHGPEALGGVLAEPDNALPEDVLAGARMSCPVCLYPLDGLPSRGTCPECGSPYDKQRLFRGRR